MSRINQFVLLWVISFFYNGYIFLISTKDSHSKVLLQSLETFCIIADTDFKTDLTINTLLNTRF